MVVPDRVMQAQRLVPLAPLVPRAVRACRRRSPAPAVDAAVRPARYHPDRRRQRGRKAGPFGQLGLLVCPLLRPRARIGGVVAVYRAQCTRRPLGFFETLQFLQGGEQSPGLITLEAQVTGAAANGGVELDERRRDLTVGGRVSRVRKPDGSVPSRRAPSMSAIWSRPSTVLMFQVNETRSRQKLSTANLPTARSISRAASAASKSASHSSTRCCGVRVA